MLLYCPVMMHQLRILSGDDGMAEISESRRESMPQHEMGEYFDEHKYPNSELVIGLVGTVGTDLDNVVKSLDLHLSKHRKYISLPYRISSDVIPVFVKVPDTKHLPEAERLHLLMDKGNEARKRANDSSILALGAASLIMANRARYLDGLKRNNPCVEITPSMPRRVHIIKSLKHPAEVEALRRVYGTGFFLIGVYCSPESRKKSLRMRNISESEAEKLIKRDEKEGEDFGQNTRDTYHLADFFVHLEDSQSKLTSSIERILDLIFGHPYMTPTFEEYCMFMAYSASLRSADLSRQVGAVIADDVCCELLSAGANDCPKYSGGLYWPVVTENDNDFGRVEDIGNGRDYMRGEDANSKQRDLIIKEIEALYIKNREEPLDCEVDALRSALRESTITDITEFGRVVHAEMEALLACGRNGIRTVGKTLFCTTFPCHNCAKHIVAAGIERVVYVEPYPKSKALEHHTDSVVAGKRTGDLKKVAFEPFEGVGPRRFFELFSMTHGSGYPLMRKTVDGCVVVYRADTSAVRTPMLPWSYLDREDEAAKMFANLREKTKDE